jgi:hypothetical protein
MKTGITGHQDLPKGLKLDWLDEKLSDAIRQLKIVTCAYSSLAIGADTLFAKVIIKMQIDLIAVIPCLHYEDTFKNTDIKVYFDLISKCKSIDKLNFSAPSEVAFFTAGKHVVDSSDVLFAIWDGNKAKGLGGTGDIVEYALLHNKKVIHLNPLSKRVIVYNQ